MTIYSQFIFTSKQGFYWTCKKRMEAGLILHTIYKVNSKWIKDLNIRAKIIKLLEEENIGQIFMTLNWATIS